MCILRANMQRLGEVEVGVGGGRGNFMGRQGELVNVDFVQEENAAC